MLCFVAFLGDYPVGWGSSTRIREWVVVEKFVSSLESLSPLGFEGGIWDVPGILPGRPGPLGVFKKFVQKKVRAHFSFPIQMSANKAGGQKIRDSEATLKINFAV